MSYKYGAYGELKESVAKSAATGDTIPVYVGVAPINLVRGYADAKILNNPVKILNYINAQNNLGYSSEWEKYTLCEAMEAHFNNKGGNIGPVYMINVLDPDTHRTTATFEHTVSLTFADKKAVIHNAGMINVETIAIDSLVLDTDYTVEKVGTDLIITDKKGSLTKVSASYTAVGTLKSLTTTNGRIDFLSDTIILDSVSVFGTDGAALVEDVDYSLDYNFTTNSVIISGANLPKNIVVTFAEVDPAKITATDIIGASIEGVYTGIQAVRLVYQNYNVVTSYIGCPGFSHNVAVYNAMVNIMTKLNGHWDGVVFADIPTVDEDASAPETIAAAKEWKKTNSYTDERALVFWPKVQNSAGQVFHGSVLGMVEQMRIDATHDNVPMETCGNKPVSIIGLYFGKNSKAKAFDKQDASELTAAGIYTFIYWGGNWVIWGDHTAAYEYGKDIDPRAIFAVNIRMLFHITNGFQRRNSPKVDKPMTIRLKDQILNEEQEQLDALKDMGALLGNPSIIFLESENSTENMINGQFRFDHIDTTPTPPAKSLSAYVAYSDAGFDAYFE